MVAETSFENAGVSSFPGDVRRLFSAVEHSYRSLKHFREMNQKLVQDYAGEYYQADRSDVLSKVSDRYLNMLNQAVDAYIMLLAANCPRVMVSTAFQEYSPFAKHFEQAINAMIKEIGLEETLRQWVTDAFFCVGVIKTHLADSKLVEVEPDLWMDPGTPFASNVGLDDLVFDTSAKKWSQVKFAGDMCRIPYADAVEMFGQEAMRDIKPNSKFAVDGERVEAISRGTETDPDEFEPSIDLADIWIPRHKKIYTFAVDNRDTFKLKGQPLAVVPWDGDEHGPYHVLGFNDVPDNIMPTSPASHLEALDSLANDLMRKCSRQAQRQKDVHLYTAGGADAAQQVQLADDGQWVNVNDKDDIALLKQGGVDPGNYAFMGGAMDMFDRMAGNLTAMMGLGRQASTVGQEKLIHEASSTKGASMQRTVVSGTVRLVKALAQMLWADEAKEIVSQMQIPGATKGYVATYRWTPGDREGNFIDYNFDIDVYSMQYQSPSAKVESLNTLLSQVYLPMLQVLMQQGAIVDFFALTKLYAELMRLPELLQIIKFTNVIESSDTVSPIATIPKAPTSTRRYVRENVSGSQQGMGEQLSMAMSQAQMGGGSQGLIGSSVG